MDRQGVVARICDDLPDDALDEEERDSVRTAVRAAFEFDAFLARLPEADAVTPDHDRMAAAVVKMAAKLSEDLEQLHDMSDVARSIAASYGDPHDDPHDDTSYTNGTTVACAPFYAPVKEVARMFREAERPIPLRWPVYPSVRELRSEHGEHFERLRAEESPVDVRIEALLNLCRLQILFLANTFC